MRIHNPRQFGICLMRKRKEAKIPLMTLANTVDIHPKILAAIEQGIGGQEIDDDLLNEIVENVPGFSLAIAHGVQPPAIPVRKLEDRENPKGKPMKASEMRPTAPSAPARMPKPKPPRVIPTDEQLGNFVDAEIKKDQ
jgi:hypothetical protein